MKKNLKQKERKHPPLPLNEVLIGRVAVDSGGLIIIDPCYLSDWKDGEYGQPNDYTRACNVRDEDDKHGEQFNVGGDKGQAVSFTSGFGDGVYPVYAKYREGRIAEVRIVMIPHPVLGNRMDKLLNK